MTLKLLCKMRKIFFNENLKGAIFTAVPLCELFNGFAIWDVPCRQTVCLNAFFWTQREHVHSCVRRALKACHWWSHPTMSALHPKASAIAYCKWCFSPLSSSPFHNNASFALFFRCWEWMEGEVGVSVGFYQHCSMLSAWARPRLWIWIWTISDSSEVDIATSQITTALISAKNNAKKTGFGNPFSTLDVSCSCSLCSIGLYFGEAWVLLSNLLSCLQMKVSGGATQKKASVAILEWPDCFDKTQKKRNYFVNSSHVWIGKDCLSICSLLLGLSRVETGWYN